MRRRRCWPRPRTRSRSCRRRSADCARLRLAATRPALDRRTAVHPHHERAIAHATETLRREPGVRALLLGGSLAHGYASEASDVDLLIVVDDAEWDARMREGRVQWATNEACDWPGGYAEGKYVCPRFLAEVARRGSEPARFAFADARILFSQLDDLGATLRAIARYPVEAKTERIRRFGAQLEAWHWYGHEALKRSDRYLLGLAVARTVLFGGRMLLAHNELLFPYHKWFLRVLESAPDRPADLMQRIDASVRNFRAWEDAGAPWPAQFLHDSELAWLTGPTPVDDL
ncbi:MAG: hypothetical protein DCC71_26080 [Proteobacteria bacterium]|nr:MAG: hypothetical protein DCC71_26080 [Pseudomonadota bacterium]